MYLNPVRSCRHFDLNDSRSSIDTSDTQHVRLLHRPQELLPKIIQVSVLCDALEYIYLNLLHGITAFWEDRWPVKLLWVLVKGQLLMSERRSNSIKLKFDIYASSGAQFSD